MSGYTKSGPYALVKGVLTAVHPTGLYLRLVDSEDDNPEVEVHVHPDLQKLLSPKPGKIDPRKLDHGVLVNIACNMGWEEGSGVPIENYYGLISELTVEEAFEKWCEWEGLINYSGRLIETLDNLREAASRPPCTLSWTT